MNLNKIERKDLSKWLRDNGHSTNIVYDKILIGNIFDFFEEKLNGETVKRAKEGSSDEEHYSTPCPRCGKFTCGGDH